MTDTFDPAWPHGHITRDGRRARIICTDARSDWPILALISNPEKEFVQGFMADGRPYCNESHLDLFNAPAPKKRIKGWLSIYPNGNTGSVRPTRAKCDELATSDRIACIEIDVEEGHGL